MEYELLTPLQMMIRDLGIKKAVELWRQEGLTLSVENSIKQGIALGLDRGRKEGAAALLERQLWQRFGPLSPAVSKKLAKASVEQVEAWSDRLFVAQSLKQIFDKKSPRSWAAGAKCD